MGSGGIAQKLLTSALDGGECSASRPGSFIPREKSQFTHCIGGWMGPREGVDAEVAIKFLALAGNRPPIPRTSSLYPVAITTELSRLQYLT
jgi:hypothetical protein